MVKISYNLSDIEVVIEHAYNGKATITEIDSVEERVYFEFEGNEYQARLFYDDIHDINSRIDVEILIGEDWSYENTLEEIDFDEV